MINPISKLIITAEGDDGEKIRIAVSSLSLLTLSFFCVWSFQHKMIQLSNSQPGTTLRSLSNSLFLLCTSLVKSMGCICTTKQQGVKEPSTGTPTLVTGNLESASIQSAFTHPALLQYLVTSTVLLETMLSLTQISLLSPSQTLSPWMHQWFPPFLLLSRHRIYGNEPHLETSSELSELLQMRLSLIGAGSPVRQEGEHWFTHTRTYLRVSKLIHVNAVTQDLLPFSVK